MLTLESLLLLFLPRLRLRRFFDNSRLHDSLKVLALSDEWFVTTIGQGKRRVKLEYHGDDDEALGECAAFSSENLGLKLGNCGDST